MSKEETDLAETRPISLSLAAEAVQHSARVNEGRDSFVQQLHRLWEVVYVLVSRQYKGRYKNTAVGFGWSLISPLLYLMVFYVVFKIAFAITIPFYATFVFTGVLAWMWVSSALNDSVASITAHASLVSQPGFPVTALPMVAILTNLVNFLTALPVLILIALIEGTAINGYVVLLPLVIVVQVLLMLSLSYLVAALNVGFRDTQYTLPVLLQLGYYVTPIFYDASTVPEKYHVYLALNPMFHIIGAYRDIVISGAAPDPVPLLWVTAGSVAVLVVTHRYFSKASRHFLEEL